MGTGSQNIATLQILVLYALTRPPGRGGGRRSAPKGVPPERDPVSVGAATIDADACWSEWVPDVRPVGADVVADATDVHLADTDGFHAWAVDANVRALRLATDFSGLETPSMALSELMIKTDLVSCCDAKRELRAFITDHFGLQRIDDDVFTRPGVRADLYAAGPHA